MVNHAMHYVALERFDMRPLNCNQFLWTSSYQRRLIAALWGPNRTFGGNFDIINISTT